MGGGDAADHSDASELCRWLNGYSGYTNTGFLPSQFTALEKTAMQEVYSTVQETGHNEYEKFTPNQTIVVPSVAEATDWFSDDEHRGGDWWWLRSPGCLDSLAAFVNLSGFVYSGGLNVIDSGGVRPAFKLNLSSVLFTSASGASKSSSFAATTTAPESNQDNYNIWNLTLRDGNSEFCAVRYGIDDLSVGTDVCVNVTSLGTAGKDVEYTQISAMLVGEDDTVLAYGKISDDGGTRIGIYDFTIPSYTGTARKLYVFAEDVNSVEATNATDYASDMADVTESEPGPEPEPPKSINLNVDNRIPGIQKGQDDKGSKIYFGSNGISPTLWRFISNVSSPKSVNTNASATVLANDKLPIDRKYDAQSHHLWGGVSENAIDDASDLCKWLNGYTDEYSASNFLSNEFTATERAAMCKTYSTQTESGSKEGDTFTPDQTVVVPSVAEVETWFSTPEQRELPSSTSNSLSWWLRTPGDDDGKAAYVNGLFNFFINKSGAAVSTEYCIRPAFQLDMSSVLFTSVKGEAKADSFAKTGYAPTSEAANYNTWKLTLKDGNSGFRAIRTSDGTLAQGENVTVKVFKLGTPGKNVAYTQISALLLGNNNAVLAYGKIAGTDGAAAGDYTFTIPPYDGTASKLYVFAEDVNSSATSSRTDYASNMADVSTKPQFTAQDVIISPIPVNVCKGYTQTFTATVSENNYPSEGFTWNVTGEESDNTTITQDGLLFVGSDEKANTLTVKATPIIDQSISATIGRIPSIGQRSLKTQ